MGRRIDIKKLLADPVLRRELMIEGIIAIQAREGIVTTWKQAASAYDKVQKELNKEEAEWDDLDHKLEKMSKAQAESMKQLAKDLEDD